MTIGGSSSDRVYKVAVDSMTVSIQKTTEESDLGVTFSHNLKFSKHTDLSVYKANRMLGVIKHTFSCPSPNWSFLCPICYSGCACVVWKPYLLYKIGALEFREEPLEQYLL